MFAQSKALEISKNRAPYDTINSEEILADLIFKVETLLKNPKKIET